MVVAFCGDSGNGDKPNSKTVKKKSGKSRANSWDLCCRVDGENVFFFPAVVNAIIFVPLMLMQKVFL